MFEFLADYWFEVITLAISLTALTNARKSRNDAKSANELGFSNAIEDAKRETLKTGNDYMEYKKLNEQDKDQEVLKTKEATYKSSIETYLNKYDDACYAYLNGQVNKKSFSNKNADKIKDLIEKDVTKNKIYSKRDSYSNIKKANKKLNGS